MSFSKLTNDLNVIQKLSDEPNVTDGLSAAQLKAKFDEAANVIKAYINNTLIAQLEGVSGAGNIGIDSISGLDNVHDVQAALSALLNMIEQAAEAQVVDGSITTIKLADLAVTAAKIAAGAISTAKLADGSVSAAKLAANAVETAKIKNGAVTSEKLAANAIGENAIADNSISKNKIQNGAVVSNKIGDNAVIAEKIDAGAVTAPKIAAGAVSTGYTGTLAVDSWEGTASPYTQLVSISGITAVDEPVVDLVPSDTYMTAVAELDAWSYVYRAVTSDGGITFYATQKPTTAMNFKARCIRK